jgi:hypothetical protein
MCVFVTLAGINILNAEGELGKGGQKRGRASQTGEERLQGKKKRTTRKGRKWEKEETRRRKIR